MFRIAELFDIEKNFRHGPLFEGIEYPWEPLPQLGDYIESWLGEREGNIDIAYLNWGSLQSIKRDGGRVEQLLYVEKAVRLEKDIFFKYAQIFIGKGTILEPSAIIKPPVIIGANCEVRQGAYIRGNLLAGDGVVIGHNTEVKNSIIMNHSEAGHFSYIGDSIIGAYVTLGAGTKIANLQFRTMEEKKGAPIRNIRIMDNRKILDTGLPKFGAIIGDGGELGCNSVTAPAVILGKECKVYPTAYVAKGVYPSGSVIK
ncbi:MAG: glucose-1-phosphate thymidylyltransferase [Nitrospinota bacterium]|nr:glucose-1-phosphate thymidylyltransferase [Nitrospinota bacterium]